MLSTTTSPFKKRCARGASKDSAFLYALFCCSQPVNLTSLSRNKRTKVSSLLSSSLSPLVLLGDVGFYVLSTIFIQFTAPKAFAPCQGCLLSKIKGSFIHVFPAKIYGNLTINLSRLSTLSISLFRDRSTINAHNKVVYSKFVVYRFSIALLHLSPNVSRKQTSFDLKRLKKAAVILFRAVALGRILKVSLSSTKIFAKK